MLCLSVLWCVFARLVATNVSRRDATECDVVGCDLRRGEGVWVERFSSWNLLFKSSWLQSIGRSIALSLNRFLFFRESESFAAFVWFAISKVGFGDGNVEQRDKDKCMPRREIRRGDGDLLRFASV